MHAQAPRVLNRAQSRLLDRLAEQVLGIPGLVLMENAGRGVADVVERLGIAGPVVICCGAGNNGGDGFVVARHLELRGHAVRVLLWAPPERLTGDAAVNYQILVRSGLAVETVDASCGADWVARTLAAADWVVDALLGTGAQGDPRPPLAQAIEAINASAARVLAIDVPSGLDCDTGQAGRPTVRAAHTVTRVTLKPGFLIQTAAAFTGQLHVVDIGAPSKLSEWAVRGGPPGPGE